MSSGTQRTYPIETQDKTGKLLRGRATVVELSERESFMRGFKIALRVLFAIIVCVIPFAIVEPFLAMIWGSVIFGIFFFFVGPVLHFKYWGEKKVFQKIDLPCPQCAAQGTLETWVSTQFAKNVVVLCKKCGQTATVYVQTTD